MKYVYLLKLRNGDIYKGSTGDLRRRMEEHRLGKVESTKHFRPLSLIGYEAYQNHEDAERRERFLKTTGGERLLKQQYKNAITQPYGEVA